MPNPDYRIIWLVRRLFRALAEKSDHALAPHGVSVAERAVMEFLYPEESLSVPAIAERYQVSRQHVQVTVNALLEKRLLESHPNPRHRRSPLFSLSESGRDSFAKILAADTETVEALFRGIPKRDRQATIRTLASLLDRVNGEEK